MQHMILIAVYLLGCALAGYWGRNRRIGFWGCFFCALAVTPVVAWIVLFLSSPKTLPQSD